MRSLYGNFHPSLKGRNDAVEKNESENKKVEVEVNIKMKIKRGRPLQILESKKKTNRTIPEGKVTTTRKEWNLSGPSSFGLSMVDK